MANLNGINLSLNEDGTIEMYQDGIKVFDTEDAQGFNLSTTALEHRAEYAADSAEMEYVTFIQCLNLKSYKEIKVQGEVFATFNEAELASKL
mgnify:CR=1 FL=1